jgi:hypothetical protein
VFFITPQFADEAYLCQEINYAIEEKTAKGDRFAIVTLAFRGQDGSKGLVPPMLRSYVWKEPENELDALSEIVRAIPLELGPPGWRS